MPTDRTLTLHAWRGFCALYRRGGANYYSGEKLHPDWLCGYVYNEDPGDPWLARRLWEEEVAIASKHDLQLFWCVYRGVFRPHRFRPDGIIRARADFPWPLVAGLTENFDFSALELPPQDGYTYLWCRAWSEGESDGLDGPGFVKWINEVVAKTEPPEYFL